MDGCNLLLTAIVRGGSCEFLSAFTAFTAFTGGDATHTGHDTLLPAQIFAFATLPRHSQTDKHSYQPSGSS